MAVGKVPSILAGALVVTGSVAMAVVLGVGCNGRDVAMLVMVGVCRVALSKCLRVLGICGSVRVPLPPPIGTLRCVVLLPVMGFLIIVGR